MFNSPDEHLVCIVCPKDGVWIKTLPTGADEVYCGDHAVIQRDFHHFEPWTKIDPLENDRLRHVSICTD